MIPRNVVFVSICVNAEFVQFQDAQMRAPSIDLSAPFTTIARFRRNHAIALNVTPRAIARRPWFFEI
jgi:hypothetical protein